MPEAWSAPEVKRSGSEWLTALVIAFCAPLAAGMSAVDAVKPDSFSWVCPDVDAEQLV